MSTSRVFEPNVKYHVNQDVHATFLYAASLWVIITDYVTKPNTCAVYKRELMCSREYHN